MKRYPTTWQFEKLIKRFDSDYLSKEQLLISRKIEDFVKKWANNKSYLKDNIELKTALDEYEEIFSTTGLEGKSGIYLYLKQSLDQSNSEIKAQFNKLDEFARDLYNKLQFFSHKISRLGMKRQEEVLNDKSLKAYWHYLSKLFNESKYLLSEKEEKLLNLKSKTASYNWIRLTQELLSEESAKVVDEFGYKASKSFSEIISLMDHKDQLVRDSAAKEFNKILLKWSKVAEAEINSVLENKKVDDTLRKVGRPDEIRHLSDDIESEVVDVLIQSVSDNYEISKRFYKLKAKILGKKKLKYHERNLHIDESDTKYPFSSGVALLRKVLGEMDGTFLSIFNTFLDEGRIDVYPKKGKSQGAFCLSDSKFNPVFILLNYQDKLQDVLTLAHEVGHGIHFELSKVQNSLDFGASLATAEVASTFMEDFILEEILKSADDETKLSILMTKLNDDISTIIRQVACYKFEQDLHKDFREKGYLSKEEIGALFTKHMSSYMGESVEYSKGSENWWIYWSHIRNFFYVYSYASGLLISKSLQESVKNDREFIKKIKTFLTQGQSKSSKEIFLDLGIDISKKEFWELGLEKINDNLTRAEMLASKLGKI